ncbi:hypothetical protein LO771_08270 [Streptacidiphilus sp. ASG 303]|uniref:hypothetical protein n=1 Tax=Streptacidiphilus sp. ASG 303 TaxID=2896847 RepID=UPI001E528547|nr:hypothetical protein [Streptacidiphilus sp. ASG 303]MCD0482398.1 hypothetical protein [Streptacidiphilus sp. ASG 303]
MSITTAVRVRSAVAVAAAAVVVAGVGAAPASAHGPASVRVKSGTTKVTLAPAVTRALLKAGILPVVTRPGHAGLAFGGGQATLTASFPVTGGRLTPSPLGGTIEHRGGLRFVNLHNGKSLEVRDFVIDLKHGNLTGRVAGTRTRVPVFTLDLSKARVHLGKHSATASNVGLNLTKTAAGALDATLKTKAFAGGLKVGTATTNPRF